MNDNDEDLWDHVRLAKFLGLSPKTVVNTLYSKPERLPPRVAHMTALRWSPVSCRQWAASPAAKRPKVGRKRLPA